MDIRDSLTTTYGYDDIDQLTSESRTGYSGSYTYDANGNRMTRTVGGVTENYAYDDADKLQDVKVGGVAQKSYGYDTAGRTTSVVSSAGTTSLAYDYEGRISTITYPSTATNTFTYNGLDTRVGKVDSAGTSTYKRDGAGVTAPVLNDGGASYTPGISERRSSTTTFMHSGLKNADSQTGTGQTIAATKQYDAFGNVLSSTGTWKGPFGYAGSFGYQEDADSSLKLLGHRYYDPSIGRFLTRDPIKDGRNWYAYCMSPLGHADPDGLKVKILGPKDNSSHKRFTDDEVKQLEKDIEKLKKTKRGREIWEKLEKDDETFLIRPGEGNEKPSFNPSTKTIITRPDKHWEVEVGKDKNGKSLRAPFEGPALLAHEGGHAAFGTKDDGPDQMDNVNKNENPVRSELGLPIRTSYFWWETK